MINANPELLQNLAKIVSKYFKVYNKIIERNSGEPSYNYDPLEIKSIFIKLVNKIFSNPNLIIKYQINFFKLQLESLNSTIKVDSLDALQNQKDKRFKNKTWQEHSSYLWLKNSYFAYVKWINLILEELPKEEFTDTEIKRIQFFIKQFIEAIAPNNFPTTNPEVLQEFINTQGKNLVNGLDNLFRDLENSHKFLWIKNNDSSNFSLGHNIACSKGKIVLRTELFELIHYSPLTPEQFEIPLLIVPPFINKFYILDLQPNNSLVNWLLEHKHNIFLISWVNPDKSLTEKSFADYTKDGVVKAIDYISKILNYSKINTVGYCVGGTLLAASTAYLMSLNNKVINTTSYLTTPIDFENAGDLSIFVDDSFISKTEEYITANNGILDGQDLGTVFSLLKPNDLIWPFFINNYLLGKDTFPFDILYWNEDSTQIPKALHLDLLKNMYKNNLLKIPNKIKIGSIDINLSIINIPSFAVGALSDHIVPWINAYNSLKVFNGPSEFILAESGHVAGIINHPDANKYHFWTNKSQEIKYHSPEEWKKSTRKHPGSWWIYWEQWLSKYSGKSLPSIPPEKINPQVIDDAPGKYVQLRY